MRPTSERDRVCRFRKKVIGNELVEAFITVVNKIEVDDAIFIDRFAANSFECLAMLLEYWLKTTLYFPARGHFIKRFSSKIPNDLLDKNFIRIAFDNLH